MAAMKIRTCLLSFVLWNSAFECSGFVNPTVTTSISAQSKCGVASTISTLSTRGGESQLLRTSHPHKDWKFCIASKSSSDNDADENSSSFQLDSSLATGLLAMATLVGSFAIHFHGWAHFVSSLSEMKANSSSQEFTSALNFWLFGALSHPILKPAFGISEVLHASPGPRLAGLVPITFLAGSGVVVGFLITSKELQKVAAILTLSLLIVNIGAGLDGGTQALLGDYNIQLDDDFHGRVVKGCPAPEAVRASSVGTNFDYSKYQGRWYWQEVHDWTQFREMYDTVLDIRLTDTGYVNTLTIKGPSPTNSPLSWDKSPLMDGVRYSWVGTIEKDDLPGVSQESGFGVTFPNYIVDVKSNENGDYQELVQFQCIEVGGVRMYEGIDFMSRSPQMSDEALQSMHQRASMAGLDAYGSSPEQMHRIERFTTVTNEESNEWQKMWKRLGIENYLDQSLK